MRYSYKCHSCEHEFSDQLPIDDRRLPEAQPCPECDEHSVKLHITSAPTLGDPIRMGMKKPPSGFNEVLRNIKKGNPGSNINIRD